MLDSTTIKNYAFLIQAIERVGKPVTHRITEVGKFILFIRETFLEALKPPFRRTQIISHMEFIGNQSLGIILMSAFSIGAVFALLIGEVFRTFNAQGVMGIATAKALTRELAPMMTAFLLTGRGGSAITAEIATMRVNEQVDAMESMGVSPVHYLVVPRVIAFMIMMPLLSGIFAFVGIFGSFVVGVMVFDVDQGRFFNRIVNELKVGDIWLGLQKAFIISIVIALIACKFGLNAKGGAKGVGQATTSSVIVTMLVFLLIDFVFTFLDVRYKG
jgi:phospholipid/cholesterol/gamma-HCH transport system permease protein